MIATMLGTHAPVAMAMYSRLTSTTAQRDAIEGAASAVLSQRNMDLFMVITAIAMRAIKERNKIAHSLWAVDLDDFPDAMLRLDTEEHLAKGVQMRLNFMRLKGLPISSIPEPTMQKQSYNPSNIFIYRAAEFEEATINLLRAVLMVQQLRAVVDPQSAEADDIYQHLTAVPAIREALDRQRKGQKSSPEAMPPQQQTPPLADT